MTECAKCGSCCAVVALDLRQEGLRWLFDQYPEERANPDQADGLWVLERMTAITHAEAAAINYDLVRQMAGRTFYLCSAYDPATKLCTAHEARPGFCRSFPWGGKAPNPVALQPHPQCSFWADVPRNDWPMGMRPLSSPTNCC